MKTKVCLLLTFVVIGAFLLSLVGCGSKNDDESKERIVENDTQEKLDVIIDEEDVAPLYYESESTAEADTSVGSSGEKGNLNNTKETDGIASTEMNGNEEIEPKPQELNNGTVFIPDIDELPMVRD